MVIMEQRFGISINSEKYIFFVAAFAGKPHGTMEYWNVGILIIKSGVSPHVISNSNDRSRSFSF